MRIIKILLFVCIYFAPAALYSMEHEENFEEDFFYIKGLYDDGYIRQHSVLLQWQEHEVDALKALVTAIVRFSSVPCEIDKKLMGTFNGRERVVFTYFDDGYIQQSSFADFKELLACGDEGYSEMIFSVGKDWYTIDGNLTIAAFDISFMNNNKSNHSVNFLSSLIHRFKRRRTSSTKN